MSDTSPPAEAVQAGAKALRKVLSGDQRSDAEDFATLVLEAAQPHLAADERERIRSLLPYHVPCCDNFYASVADLVNEHGDSQ